MSKLISVFKGCKQNKYMTKNTASNILRSLVASKFNVSPKEVILSGEIAPDFIGESRTSSYTGYNDEQRVWGFSSEQGFVKLFCVEGQFSDSGGNMSYSPAMGNLSEEIQRLCPDCIFIVVNDYSDRNEGRDDLTIFKAPNFKEYLDRVEEADLLRWEQWIEE